MRDIWDFLLQTLTASGVALLLIAVKAMLRDKLSPRWQFASWGVLALVLLMPAGIMGHYCLINWPLWVEALRSALTGKFGAMTRVSAPIPLLPLRLPASLWDWLYIAYLAGVAALAVKYILSYVHLRLALKNGRPVAGAQVEAVADNYGLPVCKAVEVEGLQTVFVCGILRPVLALPAGRKADDKVILHELLHLKYRDAAWGLAIAFFKCLHWCNPLIRLCANMAGNDLEALCDQRVLERLEGEERRDYGRILLGMADEKYARTPGTSSMANGSRNIRRRIEAIVRFKLYPAGMRLVSVCILLVLVCPILVGARARTTADIGNVYIDMASARTTRCVTFAGAFDTYAKAVITGRSDYRAMCAPLSEQDALAESWSEYGNRSWFDVNLSYKDLYDRSLGYGIYGLTENNGAWEGFLVLTLQSAPEGKTWSGNSSERWVTVQPLRAYREDGRWVVIPLGDAKTCQRDQRDSIDLGLPYIEYRDEAEEFTVHLLRQVRSYVDSRTEPDAFGYSQPDITPVPDGKFLSETQETVLADYTGPEENRAHYDRIAVSVAALKSGEARPVLRAPGAWESGYSSDGRQWGDVSLRDNWWDGPIFLSGGGEWGGDPTPPELYAADLYLNGEKAAELTLRPEEGGDTHG